MHLLVTNVFFEPFSYGGATVVAEEVVREIARQTGWKITVISTSSTLDIPAYQLVRAKGAGVNNIIISVPSFAHGADSYMNSRVEAIFSRLVASLEPDIVHAHCMQNIGIGGLRGLKQKNIPLIISTHDFWWLCERQFMIDHKGAYCGRKTINPDACRVCVDNVSDTRIRDKVLRETLAMADIITYPSAFSKGIHEDSGVSARKSIVWKNGVHGPGKGFFKNQALRREKDPRISFGFVGGPSQIKGWPITKAAFALLDRDDFIVNVVDASADQSWWRQADFKDLPGEWRILPRYNQSQLDAFYEKIDVLLFLSQWKETFGLTIREAAARGLQIIQTEGGGTTEYDGVEDAYLVQIGAGADTVAAQISKALSIPSNARPQDICTYADQARQLIEVISGISGSSPS